MSGRMVHVPVVADDGDGGAAQPDEDIEAGEIEADESGYSGRGGAARGNYALAALGRVGGRNWGRVVAARGRGGSKGLRRINQASSTRPDKIELTMSTEVTMTESLENMFEDLLESLNDWGVFE
jgi:hypothetical protein